MKKSTVLALLVLAFALPIAAQEATMNAQVARPSEAKYVVDRIELNSACRVADIITPCGSIHVTVRDTNGNDVRPQRFDFPDETHPGATVAAYFTAVRNGRAGETGAVLRRVNFITLGFLLDNGYLSGVTVVP